MKYLIKAIILVLIITQTRANNTILLYNTPLDTLKENEITSNEEKVFDLTSLEDESDLKKMLIDIDNTEFSNTKLREYEFNAIEKDIKFGKLINSMTGEKTNNVIIKCQQIDYSKLNEKAGLAHWEFNATETSDWNSIAKRNNESLHADLNYYGFSSNLNYSKNKYNKNENSKNKIFASLNYIHEKNWETIEDDGIIDKYLKTYNYDMKNFIEDNGDCFISGIRVGAKLYTSFNLDDSNEESYSSLRTKLDMQAGYKTSMGGGSINIGIANEVIENKLQKEKNYKFELDSYGVLDGPSKLYFESIKAFEAECVSVFLHKNIRPEVVKYKIQPLDELSTLTPLEKEEIKTIRYNITNKQRKYLVAYSQIINHLQDYLNLLDNKKPNDCYKNITDSLIQSWKNEILTKQNLTQKLKDNCKRNYDNCNCKWADIEFKADLYNLELKTEPCVIYREVLDILEKEERYIFYENKSKVPCSVKIGGNLIITSQINNKSTTLEGGKELVNRNNMRDRNTRFETYSTLGRILEMLRIDGYERELPKVIVKRITNGKSKFVKVNETIKLYPTEKLEIYYENYDVAYYNNGERVSFRGRWNNLINRNGNRIVLYNRNQCRNFVEASRVKYRYYVDPIETNRPSNRSRPFFEVSSIGE